MSDIAARLTLLAGELERVALQIRDAESDPTLGKHAVNVDQVALCVEYSARDLLRTANDLPKG